MIFTGTISSDGEELRNSRVLSGVPSLQHIEKIRAISDIIRVRQWYKNIIVLAPLVFARLLFSPSACTEAFIAALVFCLLSSCMYVINDIIDLEQDFQHPLKKNRPLPSKRLSRNEALIIVAIFGIFAIVLSLSFNILFWLTAFSYIILTLFYSLWLKNIFLIDIFSIGAGFILRVAAGSIVIGVVLSPWLFIATFLLALILGFSKRAAELTLPEKNSSKREVLACYDVLMLRSFAILATTCVVITYLIYAITVIDDHLFIITTIFVLYGCFRFLAFSLEKGLDPEELFKDRIFLANIILWVVSVVITLYVF